MTIHGGSESDWVAVAKRVNQGEFDAADKSVKESILIGLTVFELPRKDKSTVYPHLVTCSVVFDCNNATAKRHIKTKKSIGK